LNLILSLNLRIYYTNLKDRNGENSEKLYLQSQFLCEIEN